MAQFTVFSSTGQSTDNLWPTNGAVDVASVLTADISTFYIQLSNGTYVRYSGFFSSYSGASGINAPSAGTCSQIDITDINGNVLATLTGIGPLAADILNAPAATVLSGLDTFTSSEGADILKGFGGTDTFVVNDGHLGAGDVIDGGGNSDTLIISGGNAFTSVSTYNSTITSIENLKFHSPGGQFAVDYEIVMNWNEANSWANAINVMGRGDAFSRDTINISAWVNAVPESSLNLSNWTFDNSFGGSDRIVIDGGQNFADNVTGSSRNDTFIGNGGADTFFGGDGDDTFSINGYDNDGSTFNGGAGNGDTLSIDSPLGAQNLASYNFSSVERVRFSSLGSSAYFAAAQYGTGLAINLNISSEGTGHTETVTFNMGSTTVLNLLGITTTNWEAQDTIRIIGDADTETVTGSNDNDVIISGGGLDVIDGGFGDDVIEVIGTSGAKPVGSVLGGSGIDTLQLNAASASTNNFHFGTATVQSVERIVFGGNFTNSYASFAANQISTGLGQIFEVVGSNLSSNLFQISGIAGQTLDARGVTLTNWQTTDAFSLVGTLGNNTILGSAYADVVTEYTGSTNAISTGAGNDRILINADGVTSSMLGSVDGGADTDTLVVGYYIGEGGFFQTLDVRGLAMNSIEGIEFKQQAQSQTLQIMAAQISAGIGSINGGVLNQNKTLSIDMGAATTFSAQSLQFANWNGTDKVVINGDADSEQITGSSQNDEIHAGGGNDEINGGLGADQMYGGSGNDTFIVDNVGD